MFPHIHNKFNSVANPDHYLTVMIAPDGDLHLMTENFSDEGDFLNASVRLRMFNGGGKNVLLRDILAQMVIKNQSPYEPDFLNRMYAREIPNDYREFRFGCDDNPGSHLNLALGESMWGLQTNCHDEERDRYSGGYLSRQGNGAMVWLHADLFPKVFSELKACLMEGKNPNPVVYGDPPFHMLKLENA